MNRRPFWLAVAAVVLIGCLGEGGPEMAPETTPEGSTGIEQSLVIHEWGTFTSVQTSDGRSMLGLHHEDEPLPEFVVARDPNAAGAKSIEALPEGVNQKLETPVLYFYSDTPRSVRVDVDFPGGIISQWYPRATAFEPAVGALERIGGGAMTWDVELSHDPIELLDVPDTSIWAPSRDVASTPVVVDDQAERFIFYRGLGRFETAFRVESATNDWVVVRNESDQDIPAVFVIRLHEHGAGVDALGPLPAGGDLGFVPSPKETDVDRYVDTARALMADALIESGLYEDEAWAMVDTWTHSYFRTPGLRVLYIAPPEWADELLPIRFEPQPTERVRTMVGRVEVMTEQDELGLANRVEAAAAGEASLDPDELGRFAEPRLRRALELLDDPDAQHYCEQLIDELENRP